MLTGVLLVKSKFVLLSEIRSRGVAQLVAHLVWDQGVAGSNPVAPTKKRSAIALLFLFCKSVFIL